MTPGHVPATLLLVDDRTDNLIVLQQVLAEYLPGSTVVTAVRAEEVLGLARRTRLDAAIIDLQMPGIDGIELCRLLKSGEHAAHLPVMLISSHAPGAAVRTKGLEAGADDFVSRPIDNLELIARIKVLLRVRRAEESLRRANHGLNELVEERTAELRQAMQQQGILSRRVLMAQEEERARISREIHDGLGQVLTAIHLELERQQAAATALASRGPVDLGLALEMVRTAAEETRRICQQLRPLMLDQLGLEAAARHLLSDFERQPGVELHTTLGFQDDVPIPSDLALCSYRILQEALNNITRHAAARVVRVSLEDRGDELYLSVTDDGRGFDASRDRGDGNGLVGMRERTRQVEGSIDITSRPLEGTRIVFRAPLRGRGGEHGGAPAGLDGAAQASEAAPGDAALR